MPDVTEDYFSSTKKILNKKIFVSWLWMVWTKYKVSVEKRGRSVCSFPLIKGSCTFNHCHSAVLGERFQSKDVAVGSKVTVYLYNNTDLYD